MAIVVDRRDQTGNSTANRQRFLERNKPHIKEAIDRAISGGNVTDIGKGGADVIVPKRNLREPSFHRGQGGVNKRVHPGNKEFVAGSTIPKPPGGRGKGGGQGNNASEDGSGEDDFIFHISEKEFLEYFFGDLELPNMHIRTDADAKQTKMRRSGHVSQGPYANLDYARSRKRRMGRMFAASMPINEQILSLLDQQKDILQPHDESHIEAAAEEEWLPIKYEIERRESKLDAMKARVRHLLSPDDETKLKDLEGQVNDLKKEISLIPSWVESTDMRFRHSEPETIPSAKAVMFALMDVSGSMDQETKDRAKIFYFLLFRFLKLHYEKVDVVFIRHHTQAEEVDENEFFYGQDTGGTIVSSALTLMKQIQEERYPADQWNIYGAQASDGDNWHNDSEKCAEMLIEMFPALQGYFYTEITERPHQNLWDAYAKLAKSHSDKFWMAQIKSRKDIWPVFREFFKKREEKTPGIGTHSARMASPSI